METRSTTWQTNRLAIIGLAFGTLSFIVSPMFFRLLDQLVPPLEGFANSPNNTMWDIYSDIYIWNSPIFHGSYVCLGWLLSLAGLVLGIISIVRETQKRWIAILALLLGTVGIFSHFLGFVLSFLP